MFVFPARTSSVISRAAAVSIAALAVALPSTAAAAPASIAPHVDKVAPTLTSMSAPTVTGSRQIAITIEGYDEATATSWATGIREVRTANEDGNWGAWRTYSSPIAHTLSEGNSKKLVFVQVRDAAGNESRVLSSKVLLTNPVPGMGSLVDVIAPVITSAATAPTTGTRTITITIDGYDEAAGSSWATGIRQVRTANEDGNWGPWRTFTPTVVHVLNAVPLRTTLTRGAFVQVRDAAGNESNVRYLKVRSSGN